MTEVFADSHFFIALLNRRDQYHTAAMEASARHGLNLVTTQSVLVELGDALCHPSIRHATEQFIRSIVASADMTVIADVDQMFQGRARFVWQAP